MKSVVNSTREKWKVQLLAGILYRSLPFGQHISSAGFGWREVSLALVWIDEKLYFFFRPEL